MTRQHLLPVLVVLACIPTLAFGLEYEPLDAWLRIVDVLRQSINGENTLVFTAYVTNTGAGPISVNLESLGWSNGSFASNTCNVTGNVLVAPGQAERVVGCFPQGYDLEPILVMITGQSDGLPRAHALPFAAGACGWATAPSGISCQPEQSISHLERRSHVRATVDIPAGSPQGPELKYAYYNPDHLVLVFDRPISLGDGWERDIVLSTYGHGAKMETWPGEWVENKILANVMVSRIPDFIQSALIHPTTLAMSITVGNGTIVDAQGNPIQWAVTPVAIPDAWIMSDEPSHANAHPCPDCLQDAVPVESADPDVQDTVPDEKDQWRQYMLNIINKERLDAGLGTVTLGNNPAAQAHADSMLANCFSSHWGLDGLKPYMRYSLAGGYQSNAENVSGLSYCIKPWENYVKTSLERDIKDVMDGFMDSPGHRDNILDPHHAQVNLGLAWDDYNLMVAQHFEYGYVSFTEMPAIRNGILSFAGSTLNGAGFQSDDDMSVQISFDPPPYDLSVGQAIRTYCYGSGQMVAGLVPPLPPGYYYVEDSYLLTATLCPDPYDVSADAPPATSPSNAHDIWYESYLASSSATIRYTVPYHEAATWTVSGDDFSVTANLKPILDAHGSGVYTILVWGVVDGQDTPIAEHSVFYGINPPL